MTSLSLTVILVYATTISLICSPSQAFRQSPIVARRSPLLHDESPDFVTRLFVNKEESSNGNSMTMKDGNQQYRNVATEILSNFMQKKDNNDNDDRSSASPSPLQDIDFNAPKQPVQSLETLAAILDYELYNKEWFVTGNVNPVYFADSFVFQDPDVTLEGIKSYAEGVNTLFDQDTSRAEIIQTIANPPPLGDDNNVITCTWRLSGKANIGPAGLLIKPYIVYTDFFVQDGLIVRQEDRFDLPQWDILLSSLFPFLIGKLTKPPAPPVDPRDVPKPKALSKLAVVATSKKDSLSMSPLDKLANFFGSSSR